MDWDGKTTIKASRQGSAELAEDSAARTSDDGKLSQQRSAPFSALAHQLSLVLREPTSFYNTARVSRAVPSFMLRPFTHLYVWGHFFVVLSVAVFFALQRGPSVLPRSRH